MKPTTRIENEEGKAGYILLWLLGVPIPVLLLFYILFN
jgi:hypothetical protein